MSKIICDICGTVYPESSENCPVCGCSRDFGLGAFEEELLMEEAGIHQTPKKKNKEIFDFDEVNQQEEQEETQETFEDDEEEEHTSNTGLVVILLVLIVLLLATAGFFFIRYIMPNMVKETVPTETTVVTVPVETEPETTSDLSIPCTDIVIPGGKIELGKDGLWLMNVQVYPADTTDVLTYVSHDESVATVDENGTVTAVGEGTTVIEVTCGIQSIKCNVVVDDSAVEVTEAAGTIPALEAEQTAVSTEPSETAPGTTEKVEESTEATKETTGSMELKLKKTDITLFARYSSADLELDCDIPVESIKWFTMDSTVAIVNNGTVTATGSGMTRIYGEYNGQQVQCIVRCTF